MREVAKTRNSFLVGHGDNNSLSEVPKSTCVQFSFASRQREKESTAAAYSSRVRCRGGRVKLAICLPQNHNRLPERQPLTCTQLPGSHHSAGAKILRCSHVRAGGPTPLMITFLISLHATERIVSRPEPHGSRVRPDDSTPERT